MIDLILDDCMNVMSKYEDNHFDLAIVDPPYGIDVANDNRFGKLASKKSATLTKNYTKKNWDNNVPDEKYFKELFRVSKNQIIWGVNYYPYNFLNGGRIFWYKNVPEGYTKSKGEIAYKSKKLGIGVDFVNIMWHGMLQEDMKNKEQRFHPTQKPVKLYKWLLHNYSEKGQKILDTHLGSGSIAVACHYFGVDLVGIEIDEEYYNKAKHRVDELTKQETLF